ncbi:MAG TPA: ABC transporter permease [Longimicrobiales bacterium]|nr:ABC transporter permease [Longimicrobiales bacterium]
MSAVVDEIRFALRSLRKSPALTLVAVVTLGLGIGMNALMFSFVYGAIYRGLPFPEEERILRVSWIQPADPDAWRGLSLHDYVDLQAEQKSLTGLAAVHNGTVNLVGGDQPVRYNGGFITPNAFEALQVRPVLGRVFRPEEAVPGAPLAILLGHHVWTNDFGADPDILGRTLRVNGEQATVVGVMPEGFKFPDTQDVWVPSRVNPLEVARGTGTDLEVYGRLAPGVTREEASAELNGIAQRIHDANPETVEWAHFRVEKFSKPPSDMTLVFNTLLVTVLLVLVVACTNVANLLLARAAGRTREVALRVALGASRGRIAAKLVAEAGVLVGAGALLGLGLCWLGLRLVYGYAVTSPPPFWFVFKIDPPLLLFVLGASTLAALVAGVVPGMRVTGTRVNEVLKDEGRGGSSLRIGRLSRILVVTELAFSVGLLVAAGLFVKGMVKMRTLDYGVFKEEIFTARVGLFEGDFPSADARSRFFIQLRERLLARPEIASASLTSALPGLGAARVQVGIEGVAYGEDKDFPRAGVAYVSPGFFGTFGAEPLAGRDFTSGDDRASMPVAIVNRAFAQRFFPGEDPVGRQIREGTSQSEAPWRTIVGVVPDLYMQRFTAGREAPAAGFYLPAAQHDLRFMSIALRSGGGPEALSRILRDELAVLHPDTPLYYVRSMARALREEIWYVDLFGGLFAVFGLLALLMAAGGLYAVMATGVAQRTREMGVRMALGARAGQILTMVLGQGALQMGIGLVLGLAVAGALSRGLQAMLFGVEPWDTSVYLAISGVMLLSGLAASLVPARRATQADPVAALRHE